MKYLLDTHIIIWYTEDIQRLSSTARNLIDNPQNEIFVSIGSIFEMAIKIHIEKLNISKSITAFCDEIIDLEFQILPITVPILSEYTNLPTFADHKDPFDKLIIATAIEQDLTIITADRKFVLYSDLVTIIT